MTSEELRLKCLELAVQALKERDEDPWKMTRLAQEFIEYVEKGTIR